MFDDIDLIFEYFLDKMSWDCGWSFHVGDNIFIESKNAVSKNEYSFGIVISLSFADEIIGDCYLFIDVVADIGFSQILIEVFD